MKTKFYMHKKTKEVIINLSETFDDENYIELKANSVDASLEKHVPVYEKKGDKLIVHVGSEMHPMEEKHYIEFIEVHSPDNQYVKRKYLKAGEKPELELKPIYKNITMRAYCNVHGLWRGHYAEG